MAFRCLTAGLPQENAAESMPNTYHVRMVVATHLRQCY